VLDSRRYLIFGPAYLDVVVETAQPLLSAEPALLLDQSLAALRVTPRDDGLLVVLGPTGDLLRFILPQRDTGAAASYHLAEPVLARLRGTQAPPVQGAFTVERFCTQLGGMGAGYAAAFAGVLRAPFGTVNELPDATAGQVLHWLAQQGIRVAPAFLPDCASDSSLVLLSARGDKLAIGVRQAMLRWRAGEEERALAATADALVFCGAPNALLAEVLSWRLPAAVLLFGLANWMLFNVFEFARKSFAREEEAPGVDSYTTLYGPWGAVALTLSQVVMAVWVVGQLSRTVVGQAPLWAEITLAGVLLLAGGIFALRPQRGPANAYRATASVFLLLFYAILLWGIWRG